MDPSVLFCPSHGILSSCNECLGAFQSDLFFKLGAAAIFGAGDTDSTLQLSLDSFFCMSTSLLSGCLVSTYLLFPEPNDVPLNLWLMLVTLGLLRNGGATGWEGWAMVVGWEARAVVAGCDEVFKFWPTWKYLEERAWKKV